ncbi:MAG: SLC13 family permease [Pirellulales bacterium]
MTLLVIVGVLIALMGEWVGTDIVLSSALVILVAAGALTRSDRLPTIEQAVAGLGNPGLATVGVLFIVVAALTHTKALYGLAHVAVGKSSSVRHTQLRVLVPTALVSAFLNNTPVVAMFLPVVESICKRVGISSSKLYLPMAYAATFGGVCTLVGTSTNLVVNGLWMDRGGAAGLGMFDIARVGVPCAIVGIALLVWLSPHLLPDRNAAVSLDQGARQYFAEMHVTDNGALDGKTVAQAGLRHLAGLYLVEIERQGEIVTAVAGTERLLSGDRLAFVGALESVLDLHRVGGLTSSAPRETCVGNGQRRLIEAVVSDRCPLVGSTIRDGRFRAVYDAAVIAVARGADRLPGKLGDIQLRVGDTLLLEAGVDFLDRYRHSSDFYFVSGVDDTLDPPIWRGRVVLAILLAMIATSTFGWCDLLTAASIAAVVIISCGCCTTTQARESIDWSLLVTIAASLGIGLAVQTSGLADSIALAVIQVAGDSPWMALVAVYFVTMLLTELITNNAAAVLVYPLGMSTAHTLGASETPFVVAIMIAASAGFATPFGYQTNLMVYGPGGYRFSDYLRLGIPLDLAFMAVAVLTTPFVFPFTG